jgi:ABC-type Na+ transport system ATPase subunit NatA
MNLELKSLYRRAEGRYLDDVEAGQLRDFAEGLLTRLAIAGAIERAETTILDEVVAKLMATYPQMLRDHGPVADQLVRRDQMMVLRYATHSMIAHDPNLIYDKLSVWNRTIMVALCQVEQVTAGYRALVEACARHLTPADNAALAPYLKLHLDEFATAGSRAA